MARWTELDKGKKSNCEDAAVTDVKNTDDTWAGLDTEIAMVWEELSKLWWMIAGRCWGKGEMK